MALVKMKAPRPGMNFYTRPIPDGQHEYTADENGFVEADPRSVSDLVAGGCVQVQDEPTPAPEAALDGAEAPSQEGAEA